MHQIIVVPEGTNKYIPFVCSKYYTEGDTVKFLQNVDHPRKMRLIEGKDYYESDYANDRDDDTYDVDAVRAHLLEIKKSIEEKRNIQGDDCGASGNAAMNAMLLEARRRIEAKRKAELVEDNGDDINQ